jgi:hypothetical protein
MAIEVLAALRGEESLVPLRLEATKAPGGDMFEVKIQRQVTVAVQPDEGESKRPMKTAQVWAAYDCIHSPLPTAEMALREVLGFMELRCG